MILVEAVHEESYSFPNWGKALISYAKGGTNYEALVLVQKQGEEVAREILCTDDFRSGRSFLEGFLSSEIRNGAEIPHGNIAKTGWLEPYCDARPRPSISGVTSALDKEQARSREE